MSQCDCCRSRVVWMSLAALLGAMAGCAEVRSGYGPGLSYADWGTTFDWLPEAQRASTDSKPNNATFDAYVRDEIVARLMKKGYVQGGGAKPDFWIDYEVSPESRSVAGRSTYTPAYERGALMIEVFNPQTERLVWRGYSRIGINDTDRPTERKEKVEETIEHILAHFPTNGKE